MGEAGSQLTLDPAGLMAQAETETGLHDFGPADFEHRLDVLCRAMRDEGGFNTAGHLPAVHVDPGPPEEPPPD